MGIFKCILAYALILVITLVLKFLDKKIKLHKIVKYIGFGYIYTVLIVAVQLLIVKDYIVFSSSAVLVGGLLFGGPVGLIAGTLGGLFRLLVLNKTAFAITRLSSSLAIFISGLISLSLRKIVVDENRIKWYFGGVFAAVIEVISMLLMFLFNLENTSAVYLVVKDLGLLNLLFNTIVSSAVIFVASIIFNRNFFKVERPIGIQSKVQLALSVAIIVGFAGVASISYGVLNNSSKESTKAQIEMTFADLTTNIESDVESQMTTRYKTFLSTLKQGNINLHGDERADNYEGILEHYAPLCYLSDGTIIRADGSILASSNDYIKDLTNISDLNIKHFDIETETGNVFLPYQYVEQMGCYCKFLFSRFYANETRYYVMVTLNEEMYSSYVGESINRGVATRHIGENGFIVVCDDEKNVLASPSEDIGETINVNLESKKSLNKETINEIEYYSYVEEYVGYNFVGLMNKVACDLNMNISLYITSFTEVLVFFALYVIIFMAIRSSVISPLKRVNKTLDKICEGSLDEQANEFTSKELKNLSEDINSTVNSLKESMGKEANLIQKELNFAKQVQLSALPTNFDEICTDKIDLFATMETAKKVGGDFYDFYKLDDNHICVLIADVSGKGVPAAMFMMQSKTILKALIESGLSLEKAFSLANKKLDECNSAQMFVTVFCGILNLETGLFEFVNAGHNPPLIKTNGKFEFLKAKTEFVLAGLSSFNYSLQSIQLNPGDELFFYTDGVTEAANNDKEMFGEARLLENANSAGNIESKEFCNTIMEKVTTFVQDAEQSDDITMVHLKFRQ